MVRMGCLHRIAGWHDAQQVVTWRVWRSFSIIHFQISRYSPLFLWSCMLISWSHRPVHFVLSNMRFLSSFAFLFTLCCSSVFAFPRCVSQHDSFVDEFLTPDAIYRKRNNDGPGKGRMCRDQEPETPRCGEDGLRYRVCCSDLTWAPNWLQGCYPGLLPAFSSLFGRKLKAFWQLLVWWLLMDLQMAQTVAWCRDIAVRLSKWEFYLFDLLLNQLLYWYGCHG